MRQATVVIGHARRFLLAHWSQFTAAIPSGECLSALSKQSSPQRINLQGTAMYVRHHTEQETSGIGLLLFNDSKS